MLEHLPLPLRATILSVALLLTVYLSVRYRWTRPKWLAPPKLDVARVRLPLISEKPCETVDANASLPAPPPPTVPPPPGLGRACMDCKHFSLEEGQAAFSTLPLTFRQAASLRSPRQMHPNAGLPFSAKWTDFGLCGVNSNDLTLAYQGATCDKWEAKVSA